MLNCIPAALIILSVFVGILMNRLDVNALREDINRRFDATDRKLELIEADQKQFFTVTGKMEGRIDEISRR